MYRCRKDSHSSKNRRVLFTPFWSDPLRDQHIARVSSRCGAAY